MRRPVLTTSMMAMAVIPLAGGTATATAAPPAPIKVPSLGSEASGLVRSTKAMQATPRKTRLVVLATRIRQQSGKQPCEAIASVKRYRGTLRKLPKAARKRMLATDARAQGLSQRLLASPKAKRCGGGVAPATVAEPTPTVGRNDTSGIDLTIALPELSMGSVDKGGKLWTELGAPKAEAPQAPGQPAIPVVSYSVAVPEGATLDVSATPGATYTVGDVDVVPAQPDPVDAGDDTPAPDFGAGRFEDAKFVGPGAAYRGAPFPAKAADGAIVGASRGLTIANIQVPLAQYDGRKRTLAVRRSVDVKIDFRGGSGFGGEGSPWDKFGLSVASGLVNAQRIKEQWGRVVFRPQPCGEEFLVITGASTRAQADTLATARNASGILTRVFQTGSGPGEAGVTPAQIRDFVRSRVNRPTCVRPGYLVLLGNEELVPTFEIAGATTDLPYALANDADNLPDIASGRIPGKNATEVGNAINKIVAYGATPMSLAAGRSAFVAAQFQDDNGDGREDRTFAQFGETVAKGLEARGLNVTRIYGESPAGTPKFFNDGTALPASLKKPGFAWNGTGAQVSAAWNGGAFLGVHRDHGWSDGWGTPRFETSDVEALTNTALPVLLSINCSSGAYDRDDTSFATRSLVKPTGGAVAVFGDTEDSPSWHNTQLALGFVDALLPSILSGEGPAARQRLGDALVHGKLRLNGLSPATSDADTLFEQRIWHLFGDPTMRMRGGTGLVLPWKIENLQVEYRRFTPPGPPIEGLKPNYAVILGGLQPELNGETIALRKGGEVVGQAFVQDGKATIPAVFGDGSVRPGELSVVIDGPSDAAPAVVPVPTTKATSTVQQTCPADGRIGEPLAITGQVLGAPAGAEVKVQLTRPGDGEPVELTVKTDGDGRWSVAHTPARGEQGTWSVRSAYAGDDAVAASASEPCTVSVARAERTTTSLTQACPASVPFTQPIVVTGQLTGAPAGASVAVTFTPPSAPTGAPTPAPIVTTVTTDGDGRWSASHAPTQSGFGTWTVRSAYAGDDDVAGSTAAPCNVLVTRGGKD